MYTKGRGDLATRAYYDAVGEGLQTVHYDARFGWRWRTGTGATIVAKEALALEAGLARGILAGPSACLERRHLGFVDNQGVVACVARGRSRNGRVNGVIRRLAAVGLVTGSSFDVVWVPTTLQPADELSRRF